MENKKPPNFDWLTARLACSVRQMFEELREAIKQDVETWNDHPDRNGESTFKCVDRGNTLKVYLDDPYRDDHLSVVFTLTRSSIDVVDGATGQKILTLTIGLNDEGDCKFIVDQKEYDSWQIRRRALEPLFFSVSR